MQRLGQAQPHPGERQRGGAGEQPEYPPPGRHQHHQRADGGREDRRGHEDDEGQAHHPRHRPAGEAIAHQRHRHHPRRGDRDAAGEARGEQQLIACRKGRDGVEDRPQHQRQDQDRAAAEPVAERPPQQLPASETEHEHRDHPLLIVRIGQREIAADMRQRGQHRIDAERRHRHHAGDEHDELALAERRDAAGGNGRGGLHAELLRRILLQRTIVHGN